MNTIYTAEQIKDFDRLLKIYEKVSPEKRYLLTMAAESFANGMAAQEHMNTANVENN